MTVSHDHAIHARSARVLFVGALIVAAAVAVVGLGGPAYGFLAVLLLVGVVVLVRYPGVLFAAYLLLAFYKGAVQPLSPIDLTVIWACEHPPIVPVLYERRTPGSRRAASFASR
jgi:hypothetical protein